MTTTISNLSPSLTYTLADDSNPCKKYFRVNESQLGTIERIAKATAAVFTLLLTAGISYFIFQDLRSLCREVYWGAREVTIEIRWWNLKEMKLPSKFDQNKLENIKNLLDQTKFNWLKISPPSLHLLEDLGVLTGLENLNIHSNQLTALPTSISQLKTLRRLYAFNNQLTSLPNLEQLTALEELHISSNQLTALPASISQLKTLRKLYASLNQLTSLPNLEQLTALEELHISSNQLTAFPASISQLKTLRKLYASLNQLTSLPSLEQLIALEGLLISNNQLTALPASISQLKTLRKLYASSNQLTSLPNLEQLTALEELHVSNNQLTALPDGISQLTALKSLDLSNNHFSTVPSCLYSIPGTCVVDLEGCPLTQDAIDEMLRITRQPTYRGPRILFSAGRLHLTSRGDQNLLAKYQKLENYQSFIQGLTESQKAKFDLFLSRIGETQDYKEASSLVEEKIKSLLQWLAESVTEQDKATVFTIIQTATDTCGDRIALSLGDLLLVKKMAESSNMDLPELQKLIIGLKRCQLIEEIARVKHKSLNASDQIEVVLRYQTALKDSLELPLEVSSMLFSNLSQVSDQDIETAKTAVLEKTSKEHFLSILLESCCWREAIKKHPSFEAINKKCESEKLAFLSSDSDEDPTEEQMNQFKINEATCWNPIYCLTKNLLDKEKVGQ